MPLGRVQAGEVIVAQLDLRPLGDGEAHADEDFLGLVDHLAQRMHMADGDLTPGQGHVLPLGFQLALECLLRQCRTARLQCLGEIFTDLVGQLPHHGAFLGGERTHLLQNGSQLALFAQQLHTDGLQCIQTLRLVDGLNGPFL